MLKFKSDKMYVIVTPSDRKVADTNNVCEAQRIRAAAPGRKILSATTKVDRYGRFYSYG